MGIARKKKAGWHPADIVAAVRKRGSSLVQISADLGLASASASRALIKPHERVNRAIAEFIGVSPHVLWPQWFGASGERIRTRSSSRSAPRTSPTTRVSESNLTAFDKDQTAA